MADMPAEDALNNNDVVKRYIASLQRRKSKKCRAKYYKTRIFSSILCVALITAIFFKIQSESLPSKKPNKTKKHVGEQNPIKYDHAAKNRNKLQRKVVEIREKQRIFEDKIRMMHRTFEYVLADIRQDGGYVNTDQANKRINTALQLYDTDKEGIVDYACWYTGASILTTSDTYNFPLSDYEFFGFHIQIIYSQPRELITPDVTPGQCFAFWDNSDQQITHSQKNYITVVMMENAPEAVTGEQIILAPRTFAFYGFEDPNKIKLAEICIFYYHIEKKSTQTFAIPKPNQIMAFVYVELRTLDNDGHEDLNCVYLVHGNPY